jgi:hypothetical protein
LVLGAVCWRSRREFCEREFEEDTVKHGDDVVG